MNPGEMQDFMRRNRPPTPSVPADTSSVTPVSSVVSAPPSYRVPAAAFVSNANYRAFDTNECNVDGCLKQYCRGPVPSFVDAETVAPWVKVVFGNYQNNSDPNKPVTLKNPDITVGSNPSPQWGNLACVKSFEYQLKDGNKCRLEIVDQQGGVFTQYADTLVKCAGQLSKASPKEGGQQGEVYLVAGKYYLQVQWGWTVQGCDGDPPVVKSSPIITFLNMAIQVHYQGGLVKYVVEGVDMMQAAFALRQKKSYGEGENNDQKMDLRQAIKEMMCDGPPAICVEYASTDTVVANRPANQSPPGAKQTAAWDFHTTGKAVGEQGKILSVWQCETMTKLDSASKWLEPFRTDSDRGFLMAWDNTNDQPCLIIFEDPAPSCDEGKVNLDRDIHLGTYIVGGGPKSAVLGFTSNINFIGGFALRVQGGQTGDKSPPRAEQIGNKCGSALYDSAGRTAAINSDGPDKIAAYGNDPQTRAIEVRNSMMANKKAGSLYANIQPIDGELRIQGNPDRRFCDNRIRGSSWVAIVVLNPFYLTGSSQDGLEDVHWQIGGKGSMGLIEQSACNSVLSNKNWQILGCTHSIREGSYTTTLHVRLLVPGFDIKEGQPAGGDDAGWKLGELKGEVCQHPERAPCPTSPGQ